VAHTFVVDCSGVKVALGRLALVEGSAEFARGEQSVSLVLAWVSGKTQRERQPGFTRVRVCAVSRAVLCAEDRVIE
jgi:hypothetical protein